MPTDPVIVAKIVAAAFLLGVLGAYAWGFRRGFYRGWAAYEREDAGQVLRDWSRED